MMVAKRSKWVLMLLWTPIAACSTLVGADFDGLSPAGTAGQGNGSGEGGKAGTGGTESGGSVNAGSANGGSAGNGGNAGLAGASGGMSGSSGAGGEGGGTESGGAAGSNDGGASVGGSDEPGGAGGAGGGGPIGVPPTAVVLNELKGQGAGDDYIELYNPGEEPADLSGCYVTDDSNNRVTFPEGASIARHGYVLVRLQQQNPFSGVTTCFGFTPCYHGTWGISAATGEAIFFHDAQDLLVDQLAYPAESSPEALEDGQALGRIPDGSETVGAILISAGASNVAAP